jgi:hypothetical protein
VDALALSAALSPPPCNSPFVDTKRRRPHGTPPGGRKLNTTLSPEFEDENIYRGRMAATDPVPIMPSFGGSSPEKPTAVCYSHIYQTNSRNGVGVTNDPKLFTRQSFEVGDRIGKPTIIPINDSNRSRNSWYENRENNVSPTESDSSERSVDGSSAGLRVLEPSTSYLSYNNMPRKEEIPRDKKFASPEPVFIANDGLGLDPGIDTYIFDVRSLFNESCII